jgi:hemerythrin superfamily protein
VKATDLLKKDHDTVKEMFAEFDGISDKAHQKRSELAEQIFKELRVHAAIEEATFYPAVRQVRDKQAKFDVEEAMQEHKQIKAAMADIRTVNGAEPAFSAKMKVLKEDVEHHAEEEEKEIFKEARKLGNERLEELGDELQAGKQKLNASPDDEEEASSGRSRIGSAHADHEHSTRQKSSS